MQARTERFEHYSDRGARSASATRQVPAGVAIAWTLKNPAVTGAIAGVRNAQQARANVGAASFELTSDEVAEIEDRVVREAA